VAPLSPTERVRRAHQPEEVRALFVAESPPAGGTFFYEGNSNLFERTREAFVEASPSFRRTDNFLAAFKAAGCYLEDLAIEPVNGLPGRQRREACKAGITPLAKRVSRLSPRVIVIVSYGIERWVIEALKCARLADVEREKLPFPTSRPRRSDGVPYRDVYVRELAGLVRRWRRQRILVPV
jgi:hypothetical protein